MGVGGGGGGEGALEERPARVAGLDNGDVLFCVHYDKTSQHSGKRKLREDSTFSLQSRTLFNRRYRQLLLLGRRRRRLHSGGVRLRRC
jgi:hypothetical protein